MSRKRGGVSPDDVTIHSSALPIFADIGRFNTLSETKTIMSSAQAEDYLISLGDLLDRGNSESITFEQYQIEAIPFKEEFCSGAVSVTAEDMENPTADSLSCSRIYYVNTLDTDTDTTDLMVVTMIPDHTYLSEHNVSEISYLDKGDYSGLILYADIDGTFREACYFRNGLIVPSCPLEPGESVQESDIVHYLTIYQSSETKSLRDLLKRLIVALRDEGGYSDTIDPAYIVDEGKSKTPTTTIVPQDPSNRGGEKGHGGGGSSSTTEASKDNASGGRAGHSMSEKQAFTVTLSAQKLSKTEVCGTVKGSGTYARGALVHCEAAAGSSYTFDGWTGNMPGSGPWVSFRITRKINATAMFCGRLENTTRRPCWDEDTQIANPLVSMSIAPTNSGLLDNGIFNENNPSRYAGKHQGIDLAAEVGTPIYAPCDGRISTTQAFVTGQPQRNKDGNFPEGYTGDDNNAGNRFSIDCTSPSGKRITYSFWHLQAGTPVAINPRTGVTFKPGDAVYQGDLIGYVGRTGNAYNVVNTHLHLGVKDASGAWIDPEPYLNGNVDKSKNGKVTSAKFKNIDCDDKSEYDDSYTTSSGMKM